ncbi:MAG: hypothetical protein U1E50_16905 [Caulobacteraceae bacterium]
MPLSDLIARLSADARITPDEVLEVRREVYGELDVTRGEAEAIVALNEQVNGRCREWDQAFAEMICDIVVNQQVPRGYIDAGKAEWLKSLFCRDGRIESESEMEALAHILERADGVPRGFADWVMAQVKDAVLNGEGNLAPGPNAGGALTKGVISAGEVALLRRVLYAACSDGNVAITRAEAEVLFDLNDDAGANADPAWIDLFSKAISAAVMTVSGYQPVAIEDAARREAWLSAPENDVSGFIGQFFGALGRQKIDLDDLLYAGGSQLRAWRDQNAVEEDAMARAELINEDEALWLASRIGRNGRFDAAERAVIAFLRAESPDIHPALRQLLDAPPAAQEAPAAVPETPSFGRRSA